MIYDHISNIERYRTMGAIYEGLKYLADLSADTPEGSQPICVKAKAGVSVYTTKRINESGYETHDRMIDIQYLLTGEETIKCLQRCDLTESQPYDPERDFTLYHDRHEPATEVRLGRGYFAILFANDAHMPQLAVDEPMEVKKVVIKVQAE